MRAGRDRLPSVGERAAAVRPAVAQQPAALLLRMQRGVGNRGVAALVRRAPGAQVARKLGWTGAVSDGYGWNVGERQVGKIRRIPLELPGHGLKADAPIKDLTPERADHRVVVLVPAALDASQIVDYVVFLHGFTEDADTRPFAGWRAYKPPPDTKKAPPHEPTKVEKWRRGIDDKDVAPVRDVALDQIEAQLQDTGLTQMVIVLPQGGLTSQFGDAGQPANFVQAVADELQADKLWLDAQRNPVRHTPTTGHITMAGHSGAGATLGTLAENAATRLRHPGSQAAQDNPYALRGGDLVIFDAINGSNELSGFQHWVKARLDIDLRMLKSKPDEDAKLTYLEAAPKLRGYYTKGYKSMYVELEGTIRDWFKDHGAELGSIARCLRANFRLTYIGGEHEELMRGSGSGTSRTGGVYTALHELNRPAPASAADCPKMPEELEEEQRRQSRPAARAR